MIQVSCYKIGGAGFSLNPNRANCIAPHKRTLHTIIPGMIGQNGVPLVTFGVMGGQMQAQGHLQFVSKLVDFNMDVQNALDAPRFRVMDDSRIMLETGIPMRVQATLAQKGHHIIPGETRFLAAGKRSSSTHPLTRLSPVQIQDEMDVQSAINEKIRRFSLANFLTFGLN